MKQAVHIIAALVLAVVCSTRTIAACTLPTVTITSVTCDSVKFTWSGPNGVHFYEYCVDQFAAVAAGPMSVYVPPSSATWGDLQPNRPYYVHVRIGGCGTTDWATVPFNTPGCTAPKMFTITTQSTTASVKWNPSCAKAYHYAIKTSPYPPTDTGTLTTLDSATFTGLNPGTTYYVFVQSTCDSLGWSVKSPWSSFQTIKFPGVGVAITVPVIKAMYLYPNPAGDVLHVQVEGEIPPHATLQLLSIEGRVISACPVRSQADLSTSELPGGLYFVRYSDGVYQRIMKFNKN